MALNAANIRVGAGRIYMGTSGNPAGGTAIDLSTAGVPPGGVEVGLTEGESVFTYEITFFESQAEQSLASVAVFQSEESAMLEYTMKEYTSANLVDAMQEGAIAVSLAASSGGTDPAGGIDIYEAGRLSSQITTQTVTITSEVPNTTPQRYTYIALWSAYQSEATALRFTKSGDTLMKVSMKAIADLTRADTSTLFQIGIEQN